MDLTKFYYSASVATGNPNNDGVIYTRDENGNETELARFVGLNVDAVAAPKDGNILAAISFGQNYKTELVVSIDENTGGWEVVASDLNFFVSAAEFKDNGELVIVTSQIGVPPFAPLATNSIFTVDPQNISIDPNAFTTQGAVGDITTVGDDIWVLEQPVVKNTVAQVYKTSEPDTKYNLFDNVLSGSPEGLFTGEDGKIYLTFGGPIDRDSIVFDPVANTVEVTTNYNPDLANIDDATSRATGTIIAPPPPPPPAPTDPVFGTDGPDALTGDAGDNVIIGLGGDDSIIGLGGNDALLGGDGNDSIDAGDGNDQLFGEFGDDTLFGGAGDDALFGGLGNDFLVGDADGTTGIDGIFGGEGNDTAFGGFGADYIDGGAGGDSLYGETGADEILGGEGNDFIDGGTENDIINGGVGNDILLGGLGDDEIRGEDGDDVILGQEGNDTIFSGLGNNTVDGGEGSDRIFGDAGVDTFYGGLGDDLINGSAGNDDLFGGEGNDTVIGGVGNDTVFGGNGNDSLFGGNGNDVLFGEAGDDIFFASLGVDVINGGSGADVGYFGLDAGQNFWQDFQDGTDKISFGINVNQSNFSENVSISSTADGNSTLVTYGQNQIFLENVSASLIDEQDFLLGLSATLDDLA